MSEYMIQGDDVYPTRKDWKTRGNRGSRSSERKLTMRRFDSVGCYFIRDRKVLCVKLDQEEEREGLLARLQADGVVIDGERVQIDGVESFAVTPLRKGMEIGLRLALQEEDER